MSDIVIDGNKIRLGNLSEKEISILEEAYKILMKNDMLKEGRGKLLWP